MLKAVQSREQGGNGGKVQRQRKQLGGGAGMRDRTGEQYSWVETCGRKGVVNYG